MKLTSRCFTVRMVTHIILLIAVSTPLIAQDAAEPVVKFHWPVPGVRGKDWVLQSYVDHDGTAQLLDYRGGEKTYNGHKGTDIAVPNFRWMDNGFPVLAVASGTVITVHDAEPDRNVMSDDESLRCRSTGTHRWNAVQIEHPGGFMATYGHLKKDSAEVSVGDEVEAGQRLGVIGSSGCSGNPHLHLEIVDRRGYVVDPFEEGLWAEPPSYEEPLMLMDYFVIKRHLRSVEEILDPRAENVEAIDPRSDLSVGFALAGIHKGARVLITIRNGSILYRSDVMQADKGNMLTNWGWNFRVSKSSGAWHVEAYVDGKPLGIDHRVRVR